MLRQVCLRAIFLLALGPSLWGDAAAAAAASPSPAADRGAPLAPAEFDAIIAEARRRASPEGPPGQPWDALDPGKLARLLRMPEFAQLDDNTKAPLIDQAGAWELMHFDKPSDAQAMWARWFPDRGIDKAVGIKDRTVWAPEVFYADARWGREAGANVALLRCLAAPAWHVPQEEPMLWAMEQGSGWEAPNVFNFGECVRKQSEEGHTPSPRSPETARGKASASVLETKISAYLLAHGCEAKGPDSCLPLLHALASLNPDHEKLVPIVKSLEPGFAFDAARAIPPTLAQRRGSLNKLEFQALEEVRRKAVSRLIFLSVKLPLVLRHAESWPGGEFERTMRDALALARLMDQSGAIQGAPEDGLALDRAEYARPWIHLPATADMPTAAAQVLNKLGREAAAAPGCDAAEASIPELPESFWIGFALDKLEREQTSCGALAHRTGVARLYAAAGARTGSGLPEPLGALRHFLDKEGPARDDVITALGASCPAHAVSKDRDPWDVCRELALRKVQAATKRKKDEALAAAAAARAQAAEDKQLGIQRCSPEVVEVVGAFLKIDDFRPAADGGQIVASACKPWPGKEPLTLAAFAYNGDTGDKKRVLLALVDEKNGKVAGSWRTVIEEDSNMQFYSGSLRIDTAPYLLAPGTRAFGLDITSGGPGNRCAEGGWDGTRTLFVRDGNKLRPVLSDLELSQWKYRGGGAMCGDPVDGASAAVIESFSLTVAIAETASNGYADLLITGTSKTGDGTDGTRSKRPPFHYLLRYDGKSYPLSGMVSAYETWQQ